MPKDNAERQREYRKRKSGTGAYMCTVWLEPGNAEKLEKLVKESGLSPQKAREKIINNLLENA